MDANDIIDANDALEVLKHAAKLSQIPDEKKVVADVTGDGNIDASDALEILKYAAKLIDKFPVEEQEVTDTPAPTETPEESVPPTDVPATDLPEITDTPAPTEDVDEDTPAPNLAVKLEVISLNSAATEENGVYTFNNPANLTDGIEFKNMFAGQDKNAGGTVSFWLNSPIEIEKDVLDYIGLFQAINTDDKDLIKFDLHGTRIYRGNYNGTDAVCNFWAANMPMKANNDYYITCVIEETGIQYYCNGSKIGYVKYSGNNDTMGKIMANWCLAKDTTRLFIGGCQSAAWEGQLGTTAHKLPEGLKVWNVTGYSGALTQDEIRANYKADLESSIGTTPEPDVTEAPDMIMTGYDYVPKALNDVATYDEATKTYTFLDPTGHTDGVELENPLVGKTLDGVTLTFFMTVPVDYTHSGNVNTDYTSLVLASNPTQNRIFKYDVEGTRQYQNYTTTVRRNYWDVPKFTYKAGQEYFIVMTITNDAEFNLYIDGVESVSIEDEQIGTNNRGTVRTEAYEIWAKEDTIIYLGGTQNAPAKATSLTGHKLPEGLKIRELTIHPAGFDEAMMAEICKTKAGIEVEIEVTPTPEPTAEPTATPEPTATVEPTPVVTKEPVAEGEMPKPLAIYSFNTVGEGTDIEKVADADAARGNVLKFTSADANLKLDNPFASKTYLIEDPATVEVDTSNIFKFPLWKEGVTISYWVKGEGTETEDAVSNALESYVMAFTRKGMSRNEANITEVEGNLTFTNYGTLYYDEDLTKKDKDFAEKNWFYMFLNRETTATRTDRNNWHHVAITIKNSGATIYIDGVDQTANVGWYDADNAWVTPATDEKKGKGMTGKYFNYLANSIYNPNTNGKNFLQEGSPKSYYAVSIMEYLTDPATVLEIGGTQPDPGIFEDTKLTAIDIKNYPSFKSIRKQAGTYIDDVIFYDSLLTEAQIATLADNNTGAWYEVSDFADSAPTMEGKTFDGWYTDASCETVYEGTSGIAFANFK